MDLLSDLKARGLIVQSSAPAEDIFSKLRTVYLGTDPTADSLHAGHLMVVLTMRRLAQAGHRIILLVGGGTGMIGDPRESGERSLADRRVIERNKKALKAQMQKIVGVKVTLVDNADWLLKVKLVDFLRDIGKHFTVNELVKRDIIRKRLETPDESISYTEFAYSLLQGYDYLVLNDKYGCDLQIGATDQWTNILSGVELIRRKAGKEAFAFTCPLVTDANGKKFGKSEGNAVWLDPKKTSPFAFYQFWLNQPDEMVETYLKYFTFMPVAEIEALCELHRRNAGKREAQKRLAKDVTALVHGADVADRCVAISAVLYGDRQLSSLTKEERAMVAADAPHTSVSTGTPVVDALVAGNLSTSKSDARRLIEARGVSLNGTTVEAADAVISAEQGIDGLALLRRGKQVLVISIDK